MPLIPMPPMPTKWSCWYFLNMASCVTLSGEGSVARTIAPHPGPLPGGARGKLCEPSSSCPCVLRDVEEHASREERHEQGRAPGGDEGQRQALGRQRPRDHAQVHEGLGREHDRQPQRQVAAEG